MTIRLALLLAALALSAPVHADEKPLKILFLGDGGHHKPAERFRQLQPVFEKRGIELVYTDRLDALSAKTLAPYDGLMIYANHTKLAEEQEKALLEFVESGKGLIPLHCASACFGNSPKFIDLVGAQFQRHNTGTFRTMLANADHPIMKGFKGFESWDETYVHTKHNEKDRTVLEFRAEGDKKEPWTWVRTHGQGRVFYTAWGHDERTWDNPGFQNLVERGTRWAAGRDPGVVPAFGSSNPEMTPKRTDVKPFEYVDANIPFYAPKGGGERPRQMQKPLDAAESMKHFVTPVDFEVRPFVTEEKLGGKPIAMTWDERGRLWVALTQDYPNELQPEGQGRDRIVICADTDGDGVCDTVTTFADKLSIPTSLLVCQGGVIVHQAPHTLFLKDTTGAGKADLRQVLFTGWGTGDTHAGPSNLRYGLDNWVYGMVGYSAFNGEVAGEKINFRQGFYRFKVEREPGDAHKLKVSKLEYLRSTSNNSWGVGFTEEGLLFGSTANGCASVFMPIPNRYYERVRGLNPGVLPNIAVDNHIEPITDKVRQVDWHGGFTAAAGHEIYTARTYPKEYWNKVAFISEPTGHLTAAMTIEPNGSSFTTRYDWNLLASDDEWSAPIDAQVGSDGHVWCIDWYNFIVQHNPTPPGFKNGKGNAYDTPLRDKKHGRIYRVVYTKAKPEKPFTLKDATPEQLVAALKHDNMRWRLHAQRLLVERGKPDLTESMYDLLRDKSVDETGLNAGAVHALWTMHGLGQFKEPGGTALKCSLGIPLMVFRHPSIAVRMTHLQTVPDVILSEPARKFLLDDKHPQLFLQALLAMSGEEDPIDISSCGADLAGLLRRDELLADANFRDGWVMAAASIPKTIEYVLPENGKLSARALQMIEAATSAAASNKKLDSFISRAPTLSMIGSANPAVALSIIAGLESGWPKDHRPKLEAQAQEQLAKLIEAIPDGARAKMLKLAMTWGVKGVADRFVPIMNALLKSIADEKATDNQRILTARQIIELQGEDEQNIVKLLDVLSPRSSPELAAGVLDALGSSRAPALGKLVIAKVKDLSPAGRASALRLLLSRATATAALLDALENSQVATAELSLDQRQSLSSHTDRAIAKRAKAILSKGGGLPNPDRQKVIDEFLAVTKKKGDPELGKVVFKNQCAKCHMHGTEGARIGPDLTGVAVHTKEHLLVDILDPSRSVEGNYREFKVTTLDGKIFSGLLAAETKTTIEVIDAEAKKHTLQRQDIEELRASAKSLMPEGFEKQFKGDDLANLLEFLTQKGKYLPLPLDKAATVVSTRGMFYNEESTVERLIFSDWTPKTFDRVPFQLIDPQGDKARNVILLNSTNGKIPPSMPKTATVPCNTAARAIHLLGGVSGWGYPLGTKGSVSMIVRLRYDDGKTEDHELKNGEHLADYIRRVDVPASKFAFAVRGQQVRYLAIVPKRENVIKEIEFIKGPDATAPIVVAVTVETR